MHWSVMAWQEVVVATFNLFSVYPDITTKGPDGPGAALPLSAVAGPAKLLWHLQQWHPGSLPLAMGLMNCSRDILSLERLQAVSCFFEASHHLKWINTGFKLWSLQTIFWMFWFFTLISLLFALFLRVWGFFVLMIWGSICLFGLSVSFGLLLETASLSILSSSGAALIEGH